MLKTHFLNATTRPTFAITIILNLLMTLLTSTAFAATTAPTTVTPPATTTAAITPATATTTTAPKPSTGEPLDRVVAIVNNSVITQSQLNVAINDVKIGLQMVGAPIPNAEELKKQALDQLILKNLQLDIAARNKMTVSDKQVDEAINKIAGQNHLTLDQLKEAVDK